MLLESMIFLSFHGPALDQYAAQQASKYHVLMLVSLKLASMDTGGRSGIIFYYLTSSAVLIQKGLFDLDIRLENKKTKKIGMIDREED